MGMKLLSASIFILGAFATRGTGDECGSRVELTPLDCSRDACESKKDIMATYIRNTWACPKDADPAACWDLAGLVNSTVFSLSYHLNATFCDGPKIRELLHADACADGASLDADVIDGDFRGILKATCRRLPLPPNVGLYVGLGLGVPAALVLAAAAAFCVAAKWRLAKDADKDDATWAYYKIPLPTKEKEKARFYKANCARMELLYKDAPFIRNAVVTKDPAKPRLVGILQVDAAMLGKFHHLNFTPHTPEELGPKLADPKLKSSLLKEFHDLAAQPHRKIPKEAFLYALVLTLDNPVVVAAAGNGSPRDKDGNLLFDRVAVFKHFKAEMEEAYAEMESHAVEGAFPCPPTTSHIRGFT